jgi:hypothetical protein
VDQFRILIRLGEKKARMVLKHSLKPEEVKMIGEIARNVLGGNITKKGGKDNIALFKHKALIRKLGSKGITSEERHRIIKNNTAKVLSLLGIALKKIK